MKWLPINSDIIITCIEAREGTTAIAKALGISRNTVYKAKKAYEEHGTTDYLAKTGRPVHDGKEALIKVVRAEINKDPNQLVRSLARKFNVAESTMRAIVKSDLGLKSLAVLQVQQLTPLQCEKHLKMCRMMVNKLKREVAGKILIFSDEKDFHLSKHLNHRNARTIAPSAANANPSNRFQGCPKFPKKAMFFGFIGSDGKAFPGVWTEGTMDAAMYRSILIRKVILVLNTTYGAGNYIWMQDGASCHTANIVLQYLKRKLGSKGFWSKGIWPPNSYNLNPLDFSVWNHVDKMANNVFHPSIDAMKAAVEREWTSMSADYVRATCARFRPKLEACIAAEGGVFEKV